MKKNYFLLIFFSFSISYSQLPVPFKLRYNASLKGDMTVISNNITNRVENNSSNVPYNTTNINSSKHNDEFIIGYIDIDSDKTTFSSSSADLILENQDSKKVVYAGLYWSATYKYNSGELTKKGAFLALDPAREPFNEIKIKLPNQENYIDIIGEVLFDGLKQRRFKENSPYAVYADITKEITSLSNPAGTYTVANVKSTIGLIKGGVAAGWTMLIVYKDETMNLKDITSFDGFAGISNKPLDLLYSGFQSAPEGHVNAKLAFAALEGDSNLVGDQVLFKISKKNKYQPLSNLLRKEDNFFNSSITIENEHFLNRNPQSKNTLGYDSSFFTLANNENDLIGNNITEAKIRLKTSGDKFYLFFTAFNVERTHTEISKELNEIKENPIAVISTNEPTIVSNETPIKITSNDILQEVVKSPQEVVAIRPKVIEAEKTKETSSLSTSEKEIFNYNIDGQPNGYYIIVNVFAKQRNSINFVKFLKNKGLDAASFFNPVKNYYYVYIIKSDNKEEVVSLHNSKFNNSYKEDMWVLSVNKSKESSFITQSVLQKDKEESNDLTITNNNQTLTTNKKEVIESQSNTENKVKTNSIVLAKETKELQNRNQKTKDESIVSSEKEIFNYEITQQEKGYYLIVNVFSKQKNSINFIRDLKNKGLDAASFFNPVKKYYYVYIIKSDNKEEIISLQASNFNNAYKEDMWVLSVNNSKLSSTIVNTDSKKEKSQETTL